MCIRDSFHPCARAEADTNIRAVGDLEGAGVSLKIPKYAARDATQLGHRRIIRMDADPHPQLFCNRNDLFDEIRVVIPKLFRAEFAAVGERAFEDLAAPVSLRVFFHVERARRRSTASGLTGATPDAIPHV